MQNTTDKKLSGNAVAAILAKTNKPRYDYEEIKHRGNCLDFMKNVLGAQPASHNGKYTRYNCPWKPDADSGSFSVSAEGYTYFAGGGGEEDSGSILDLCANAKFGGDIKKAGNFLGDYLRLQRQNGAVTPVRKAGEPNKPFPQWKLLSPDGNLTELGKKHLSKTYDYNKAENDIFEQSLRFERGSEKTFRRRINIFGDAWSPKGSGTKAILYNLPAIRDAQEVYIVEGEKCADFLNEKGFCATTLIGGAQSKWLPQYSEMLKDKKVVIIPDGDSPGMTYALRCARGLLETADATLLVPLPNNGKGDIIDYVLGKGSINKFNNLVKNASPLTRTELDEWDKKHKAEISAVNGMQGGRPSAPPAHICADGFIATMRNSDNHNTLRFWRGEWFQYNTKHGWRTVSETTVRGLLVSFLRASDEYRDHANKTYVTSIMMHLETLDLCGVSEHTNLPIWLNSNESADNWMRFSNNTIINVWNYALSSLGEEDGTPYQRNTTPAFFSRDIVPYEWNPDAECPKFHAYLNRVIPDVDTQHMLCQFAGLCLANITKYEVFAYLYGPTSRNGKTVFLDILAALVGNHNVSRVDIANLTKNFALWPLGESKVNVCGDMPTKMRPHEYAQIEGVFKDLVSGGEFEYEKKNQNKFKARCRSRFIFAGNSLPAFADRSDAIWKRMRIIHFPVQIPLTDANPDLAEEICATELPGICQWALQGLAMIMRNQTMSETPEALEIKSAHRETSNNEATFLHEYYETGGIEDRLSAREIYKQYVEWTTELDLHHCAPGTLYSQIPQVIKTAHFKKSLRVDNMTTKGFYGVKKHPDLDPNP